VDFIIIGLALNCTGSITGLLCWGFPKYKRPHWHPALSPCLQIATFSFFLVGFALQIVGLR